MHLFTACVLSSFVEPFLTLRRNYLSQKSCCCLQSGRKNLFILLKSVAALYVKNRYNRLVIYSCLFPANVQLIVCNIELLYFLSFLLVFNFIFAIFFGPF